MIHVWNIYEPCDPRDLGDDPFDIFVYSLRREEAPLLNAPIYLEGRRCRIVAIAKDHSKTEVFGFGEEQYHKVCVVPAL
jgi:hypothetical protein